MKQKLRVAKFDEEKHQTSANGLISINPNKPDYGSMMLIATAIVITNGFMNKRNKVAFVVGSVEELESLVSEYNLKEGDDYSEKVSPSRIVTLEITESEFEDYRRKDETTDPSEEGWRVKINPQTEEVLLKDGEVIYWKTEIVAEGSDQHDRTLQYNGTSASVDEAREEFSAAATEQVEETKKATSK